MFKKTMSYVRKSAAELASGAVLAVGSAAANASVDTSAITTATTDVASVGSAVFTIWVGIKCYKMLKSAL